MRKALSILVFVLFSLCFNSCKQDEKKNNLNTDTLLVKSEIVSNQITETTKLEKIFNEINLNNIKLKFGGGTSGVLPKAEAKHLYYPNTEGFYGQYFLINRNLKDKKPFQGIAIIYSNSKDWKFEDANEELIEITTYNKELHIIPNISIGSIKEDAVKLLGKPNLESGDLLVYHDSSNVMLSIIIKDGAVSAIKIGKYSNFNRQELYKIITTKF